MHNTLETLVEYDLNGFIIDELSTTIVIEESGIVDADEMHYELESQ